MGYSRLSKTKITGVLGKAYFRDRKNCSEDICVYILTHNLLQADMESLYLSYHSQPNSIKSIIEDNAEKNIEQVIGYPCIVSTELKKYLLKSKNVEDTDKIYLLLPQ